MGKKKPGFRMTDSQFREAEAYVQAAQHLLGLQAWRIEVTDEPAEKGNDGQIHLYSEDDFIANLRFGAALKPWTRPRIAQLVVHELLHPFLHDLIQTATRGRGGDAETTAQGHRIINVLTPILADIVTQMVEFEDEGEE